MTTGRSAGTTAVPTATDASSYSTEGWSVSPTSVAQAANARICAPGRVAPTGVPGLTANAQDSSGHSLISWTNFTEIVSTPAPRYSVIRSDEVNTTTYGWPSTCSRRHTKPGSPGFIVVEMPAGIGISTLASSSVDRKWSVCPSLAAASSSASTSFAGSKSGSMVAATSGLPAAAQSAGSALPAGSAVPANPGLPAGSAVPGKPGLPAGSASGRDLAFSGVLATPVGFALADSTGVD